MSVLRVPLGSPVNATHSPLEHQPFVTVAIPCLDEEAFIEACIDCVLRQDYPADRIEVIVADGGSRDRTRNILTRICSENARVRWIDNPQRIQAAAMNAIISEARGDVVVRLDAHCAYAENYVSKCVEILERTGADNVGGAQRPLAASLFQRALCAALDSPLGVGGARYRSASAEGFVDTVWLGAFRRSVLLEVGMFDAGAITNEDAELNQRIVQAGGKVYLSPEIEAHYHPRGSFRALARQYFRYGFGRARTVLKHGRLPNVRPVTPFAMVTLGAVMVLSSPWHRLTAPAVGAYTVVCAVEAVRVGRGAGIAAVPLVGAIFPVLHVSHGVGFAAGLWHYLRSPDWASARAT